MLSFFFLAVIAVASAEVARQGPCPDLKPVENFDIEAYQGTWYEIAKFYSDSEKDGTCGSAEYLLKGDIVSVKNVHVVNGVQTYVEGTAKIAADANNRGIMLISLNFGKVVLDVTKYIIATDYKNYGLSYICHYDAATNTHRDFFWVLSRTTKLEGDVEAAVDAYLNEHSKEIDTSRFINGDFSEEACKFTSTKRITIPTRH